MTSWTRNSSHRQKRLVYGLAFRGSLPLESSQALAMLLRTGDRWTSVLMSKREAACDKA